MKEIITILTVLLGLIFVILIVKLLSGNVSKKLLWAIGIVMLVLGLIQYYLYFYLMIPPPEWSEEFISKNTAPIACVVIGIIAITLAIKLKKKMKIKEDKKNVLFKKKESPSQEKIKQMLEERRK